MDFYQIVFTRCSIHSYKNDPKNNSNIQIKEKYE